MTHEVSPELALVDPSLREQLLAEPDHDAASPSVTSAAEPPALAAAAVVAPAVTEDPPVEPVVAPPPPSPSPPLPSVVESTAVATESAGAPAVRSRGSRVRFAAGYSLLLLALAAAGYGLVSLLHGGSARTTVLATSSSIGRPAASPATTVRARTTTARAATHPVRTTKKKPPVTTRPRTLGFSWPAVNGATGYHVAFYAHGVRDILVYQTKTRVPRLVVRVRSGHVRSANALAPGSYLWYVWPIVGGRQSSAAVVRSKLQVR